MASSCIPAGLRLDLEMVKAAGAAAPPRPAHSAAASSTLSEASNASSSSATSSVASLSLKRPRTPRKRPNQTYNEAAALLASMYPSVFPAAKGAEAAPPRLLGLASALADDPDRSDLLPPFPVLDQAAFLLRDLPPPPQSPAVPMPMSPAPAKSCPSPAAVNSVFSEFRDPAPSPATPDAATADEPGELDFDDDDGFDADSILCGVDESAAEGIDGIMGKLSMENNAGAVSSVNSNLPRSKIHPYLRSLMVLGLSFRQHDQRNINQALKRHNVDPEWWMCPAIPVKDIARPPLPLVAKPMVSEKKKSKKKLLDTLYKDVAIEHCKKEEERVPDFTNGGTGVLALPETGLGLRLNTERVIKAWCGRGSVFADRNTSDLPLSSADVLVSISSFFR
jgi:hypothetical protein